MHEPVGQRRGFDTDRQVLRRQAKSDTPAGSLAELPLDLRRQPHLATFDPHGVPRHRIGLGRPPRQPQRQPERTSDVAINHPWQRHSLAVTSRSTRLAPARPCQRGHVDLAEIRIVGSSHGELILDKHGQLPLVPIEPQHPDRFDRQFGRSVPDPSVLEKVDPYHRLVVNPAAEKHPQASLPVLGLDIPATDIHTDDPLHANCGRQRKRRLRQAALADAETIVTPVTHTGIGHVNRCEGLQLHQPISCVGRLFRLPGDLQRTTGIHTQLDRLVPVGHEVTVTGRRPIDPHQQVAIRKVEPKPAHGDRGQGHREATSGPGVDQWHLEVDFQAMSPPPVENHRQGLSFGLGPGDDRSGLAVEPAAHNGNRTDGDRQHDLAIAKTVHLQVPPQGDPRTDTVGSRKNAGPPRGISHHAGPWRRSQDLAIGVSQVPQPQELVPGNQDTIRLTGILSRFDGDDLQRSHHRRCRRTWSLADLRYGLGPWLRFQRDLHLSPARLRQQ